MNVLWNPSHSDERVSPICPFRQCDPSMAPHTIARGTDFEYQTLAAEMDYKQCERCNAVFATYNPEDSFMSRIYPENYYSFHDSQRDSRLVQSARYFLALFRYRTVLSRMTTRTPRILDIGCGDGALLRFFKRRLRHARITGLDSSVKAVQVCIESGVPARVVDIETADAFDAESRYDLIVMNQVLEHLRDPRAVLNRIRELLDVGGLLSLETPAHGSIDHRVFKRRYWAGYHIPRHFWIFDETSLRELLELCGLSVVHVEYLINPVAWVHSLQGWVSERRLLSRFSSRLTHRNIVPVAVFALAELVLRFVVGRTSNIRVLCIRDDSSASRN